jgi:hypothetical protein
MAGLAHDTPAFTFRLGANPDPPGAQPMIAEVESLVLEMLQIIQADMADMKDEMKANRIGMSSVDSHLTAIHLEITPVNARIDGLSKRVGRLEGRLELP